MEMSEMLVVNMKFTQVCFQMFEMRIFITLSLYNQFPSNRKTPDDSKCTKLDTE